MRKAADGLPALLLLIYLVLGIEMGCGCDADAASVERPSLAELFKRAYEERDERRAAKAERNYRQAGSSFVFPNG